MNRELYAFEKVMHDFESILPRLKRNHDQEFVDNILLCMSDMNEFLYGGCMPRVFSDRIGKEIDDDFYYEVLKWYRDVSLTYERLKKYNVKIDYDFYKLMIYIESETEEQMLEQALKCFNDVCSMLGAEGEKIIIRNWNNSKHLWGEFDPCRNIYDHITNGIHELKSNREKFIGLYEILSDYRSKLVLYSVINFWLTTNACLLDSAREKSFPDYYDYDVLCNITSDEIFVDLGAYTGDSALGFYEAFGDCRKMYLYDMSAVNLSKAKEILKEYENVVYRNVGVTNPVNEGKIIEVANVESSEQSLLNIETNQILFDKEVEMLHIPLVTLDNDIEEPVSFIKMDIEGAEVEAIEGAKRHIREDHPTLAICTYHRYDHMWRIPELILSYNPDYKFYMRYNGEAGLYNTSEYVLLAVPV